MATCESPEATFEALDLPREFEDLEGLLRADLQAIVTAMTVRANERLFLTPREFRQLQVNLWNGLTQVLNEALEPLSADYR
jgi:hypothetical protein